MCSLDQEEGLVIPGWEEERRGKEGKRQPDYSRFIIGDCFDCHLSVRRMEERKKKKKGQGQTRGYQSSLMIR
ncbi:hypothetical protein PRIPAC_97708 [Pristionchus pacificus]|uniref:Uncharacterized protein n=1 Tax=Pristionchus pacificus TaxID=54126 RepID=A0A2A6BK34_PRIPA|nr:hypothetical protein PRIPAC_97708 [Pristionchus pacificus]|eukprot:PDM66259.1 hypothetical protein PRIPAC_45484 [Pristionchus pacificus]